MPPKNITTITQNKSIQVYKIKTPNTKTLEENLRFIGSSSLGGKTQLFLIKSKNGNFFTGKTQLKTHLKNTNNVLSPLIIITDGGKHADKAKANLVKYENLTSSHLKLKPNQVLYISDTAPTLTDKEYKEKKMDIHDYEGLTSYFNTPETVIKEEEDASNYLDMLTSKQLGSYKTYNESSARIEALGKSLNKLKTIGTSGTAEQKATLEIIKTKIEELKHDMYDISAKDRLLERKILNEQANITKKKEQREAEEQQTKKGEEPSRIKGKEPLTADEPEVVDVIGKTAGATIEDTKIKTYAKTVELTGPEKGSKNETEEKSEEETENYGGSLYGSSRYTGFFTKKNKTSVFCDFLNVNI